MLFVWGRYEELFMIHLSVMKNEWDVSLVRFFCYFLFILLLTMNYSAYSKIREYSFCLHKMLLSWNIIFYSRKFNIMKLSFCLLIGQGRVQENQSTTIIRCTGTRTLIWNRFHRNSFHIQYRVIKIPCTNFKECLSPLPQTVLI